jgi:hypothetical protein
MPNVSAYIRVGDLDKWSRLKDKSTHLHDLLNSLPPEAFNPPKFNREEFLTNNRNARVAGSAAAPPFTPPVQQAPAPIVTRVQEPPAAPQPAPKDLTAHLPENIRGAFVRADSIKPPAPKELQPCCKDAAPCRHWVWDISSGDGYINSLTGAKKTVD